MTFVSNVGIGAGNSGGTVVNAGTLSMTAAPVPAPSPTASRSPTQEPSRRRPARCRSRVRRASRLVTCWRSPRMPCSPSTVPPRSPAASPSGIGTYAMQGGTLSVPAGSDHLRRGDHSRLDRWDDLRRGTLTVDGPLIWTGGTMSGTGTTIANGTMALGTTANSSNESLVGWTLNNFGAATESYNSSVGAPASPWARVRPWTTS